jgi:subtilisin-like proprotein convertase family protein
MNEPGLFASALCISLLTLIARSGWAQQPVEFSNPQLITINTPRLIQEDGSVLPMVATPYPSTIEVSGFTANEMIEKITVTLHDLSHTTPDDIDILLVGPGGQNVVLFSDAGGGFFDLAPIVTVTLDDDADEFLPDEDEIVSGTYKPTNYELGEDDDPDIFPDQDEDGFPAPHPRPDLDATLSIFAGTPPNGEWRLYVVDDDLFEDGRIANGWSLKISTRIQLPPQPFNRSDSNTDGAVDLADAVVTLDALFLGGQLECADAADADDNGVVELTDVVFTLDYLFLSGPVPPAPGVAGCWFDPTEDELTCDSVQACGNQNFCFGNQLPCNGICREVDMDPSNCGGCGIACGPNMICQGGQCVPAE